MDYTQFTAVKNKLAKSPNLCDLFKLISIETWSRLEYAYVKPGVKVFETTLTQNLIFTINAYADQYGLDIEIFEAKDERTNGNDFELIIRYPSSGLEYYTPIQAKKVYRNGKYASMDHGDQINSLIDYAELNNARPFYLLYNFNVTSKKINAAELFGCTLIPADYLFSNYYNKRTSINMYGVRSQKWLIPSFDDLNAKHAFAWQELICSNNPSELLKLLSDKKVLPSEKLKSGAELSNINQENNGLFTIGTLSGDDKWINIKSLTPQIFDNNRKVAYKFLRDPQDVVGNMQNDVDDVRSEITYPDFAPQSRIIITKD